MSTLTAEAVLDHAKIDFDGTTLTAQNSYFERNWTWTGKGFLTQKTGNLKAGKTYSCAESGDNPLFKADWTLPGYEFQEIPEAVLTDVAAELSDDEGFTSQHINFTATMKYEKANVEVQFIVWLYKDAPGVRTQLKIRALSADGMTVDTPNEVNRSLDARLDYIPMKFIMEERRWFGFNADTQRRNDTYSHILKEEVAKNPLMNCEFSEWSSVQCVESRGTGIAMVKESHKCVNQIGHHTGIFKCDSKTGMENFGWGVVASEVDESWRSTWGAWTLVYDGEDDYGRESAFKKFDRIRYPVHPERDFRIQANTWGSSALWLEHRDAASEENVLKELESCADLGIETLQIDDGWQGNDYESWTPSPERYPEGWKNVVAKAQELGISLGLWASASAIPLSDLKKTHEEAKFVSYKLDFADLTDNAKILDLMEKVREFIKSTGHTVRVNWDVTEREPRYGYFFAREYGNLYPSNRKPLIPSSTTYRPHTMLRDLWQLSKYLNLAKIQGSIQNVDRVNKVLSDAHLYGHAYSVATCLMCMPLFFQQTFYYDEKAREEIKPLLTAYKEHREAILAGQIDPIGSCPDGAQWTGFQSSIPGKSNGYLTIFREINCTQGDCLMKLVNLLGRRIRVTNLLTQKTWLPHTYENGYIEFSLDNPGSFHFCKYEVEG